MEKIWAARPGYLAWDLLIEVAALLYCFLCFHLDIIYQNIPKRVSSTCEAFGLD